MGDPRKLRKHYSKPSHPWQKQRIDDEKVLMNEYGFKNKIELWTLNSRLGVFKRRVKELIPLKTEAAEAEKKQLLNRLYQFNLVKENGIPEDILAITLKDFCERRLQTLVVRKGLAKSIKQARQFIVHEHIMVGDHKITSPSYITTSAEEVMLKYAETSPIASEEHPERTPAEKEIRKEMNEAGLKPHETADMPAPPASAPAPEAKAEKPARKKRAPKQEGAKEASQ